MRLFRILVTLIFLSVSLFTLWIPRPVFMSKLPRVLTDCSKSKFLGKIV